MQYRNSPRLKFIAFVVAMLFAASAIFMPSYSMDIKSAKLAPESRFAAGAAAGSVSQRASSVGRSASQRNGPCFTCLSIISLEALVIVGAVAGAAAIWHFVRKHYFGREKRHEWGKRFAIPKSLHKIPKIKLNAKKELLKLFKGRGLDVKRLPQKEGESLGAYTYQFLHFALTELIHESWLIAPRIGMVDFARFAGEQGGDEVYAYDVIFALGEAISKDILIGHTLSDEELEHIRDAHSVIGVTNFPIAWCEAARRARPKGKIGVDAFLMDFYVMYVRDGSGLRRYINSGVNLAGEAGSSRQAWISIYMLFRQKVFSGREFYEEGESFVELEGLKGWVQAEVAGRLISLVRSGELTLKDLNSYHASLIDGGIAKTRTSFQRFIIAIGRLVRLMGAIEGEFGLEFTDENARSKFRRSVVEKAKDELEPPIFRPRGPTLRSIVILIGAGLALSQWGQSPCGEALHSFVGTVPNLFMLSVALFPDLVGRTLREMADTLLPRKDEPNPFESIPEGELGVIDNLSDEEREIILDSLKETIRSARSEQGIKVVPSGMSHGRFSIKTDAGEKYAYVLWDRDGNAIVTEAFFDKIKSVPEALGQAGYYAEYRGAGWPRKDAELLQLKLRGREPSEWVFKGDLNQFEPLMIKEMELKHIKTRQRQVPDGFFKDKVSELEYAIITEGVKERWFSLAEVMRRVRGRGEFPKVAAKIAPQVVKKKIPAVKPKKVSAPVQPKAVEDELAFLDKLADGIAAPENRLIADDDVMWLKDFINDDDEIEETEAERAAEAVRRNKEAQEEADREWDARLKASLEKVAAEVEAAERERREVEEESKRQEEEAERQRQEAEAAKRAEIERARKEAEEAREREKRKLDDLLKWFIEYAKEVNGRLRGIISEAQKQDEAVGKAKSDRITGMGEKEIREINLRPLPMSGEEETEKFISATSEAIEKKEREEREAGEFIENIADDIEEIDRANELKEKKEAKAKSLRALLITINRNKDKFKDAQAKAEKIKDLRGRIKICAYSLERKRNEKTEIAAQLDGVKERLIKITEDAENALRGLKNLIRRVIKLKKKRHIEKHRRDLMELLEMEKSREAKIYKLLEVEETRLMDTLERRKKLKADLENKRKEIAETMAELERLMNEVIEIEEILKSILPDLASKTADEVIIEGLDEAAQPLRNKVYRLASETKDGIERNRSFVVTTLGSLGLANTDEKIEQVTSRKDKLGKGSPEIEDTWLKLAKERLRLERLRNKFENEQALLREALDRVKRIEEAASERQRQMEKNKREGKLEEFEKAWAVDRAACEKEANELENLKKVEEARGERLKRYEFLINERKKRVADNLSRLSGLIDEAEEPRTARGAADEALDSGKLQKEFSELLENINRDFAEDERLHGELVALVESIEKGGGIKSGLYRAAKNSNKERPPVHAGWKVRIGECRGIISEAIAAKGAGLGEAHRKLEVLRGIAKELEKWVRDDTRRLSELKCQAVGDDGEIDKEIDNLRNGAEPEAKPAEEEPPLAVSQKDPILQKREMIAGMIKDFVQLLGGPIYPSLQNLRMHTDTAKWIEVFSEGRLRRDDRKITALSDGFIAHSLGQIKPEKRDGSSNAAAERTRYYNEAGLSMDAQRKTEEFLRRFELWMMGRRGAVESIMLDVSNGLGITDAMRSRKLRGVFIKFELKVQEEVRDRDMKNRAEREEAETEIRIATQELLKDIASVALRTEVEEEKWLVGLVERYASFARSEVNALVRMESENPHLELIGEDSEKLYSIIFAIQSHDLLRGEKESFRALFERKGLRDWIGHAASFIGGPAAASDWLETAGLGHGDAKRAMADKLRVKIMAMDGLAQEALKEYLERLNNYRGSPLYIDKEGTIKVAYAGVRKEQMLADAEDSARGVGHEALWENVFGSEGGKMMHFCAGQNLNAIIDRLRGRLKVDVPRGSRVESAFPSNSLMGEILHTILRRKERNLGSAVQMINLSIFRERVEAEYRRKHGMPPKEGIAPKADELAKPDELRIGLLAPASRFEEPARLSAEEERGLRERFVVALNHNMNQPITVICSTVPLIQQWISKGEGFDEGKVKEAFEDVRSSVKKAHHIAQLIRGIVNPVDMPYASLGARMLDLERSNKSPKEETDIERGVREAKLKVIGGIMGSLVEEIEGVLNEIDSELGLLSKREGLESSTAVAMLERVYKKAEAINGIVMAISTESDSNSGKMSGEFERPVSLRDGA